MKLGTRPRGTGVRSPRVCEVQRRELLDTETHGAFLVCAQGGGLS